MAKTKDDHDEEPSSTDTRIEEEDEDEDNREGNSDGDEEAVPLESENHNQDSNAKNEKEDHDADADDIIKNENPAPERSARLQTEEEKEEDETEIEEEEEEKDPNKFETRMAEEKLTIITDTTHERVERRRRQNEQEEAAAAKKNLQWLSKLIQSKQETDEEKRKRLKEEALLKKQHSGGWGKEILEEEEASVVVDEKEEHDDDKDDEHDKDTGENDNDDDDTVEDDEDDNNDNRNSVPWWKRFGGAEKTTNKNEPAHMIEVHDEDEGMKDVADNDDNKIGDDEDGDANSGTTAMVRFARMMSLRNKKQETKEKKEHASEDQFEEEDLNNDPTTEEDVFNDVKFNFSSSSFNCDMSQSSNALSSVKQHNMKTTGNNMMLSMRTMWGKNRSHTHKDVHNNDENDGNIADDDDNKSMITALSASSINIIVKTQQTSTAVSEWWEQTRLKMNPEVWLDPQLHEYLQQIQSVKLALHEQRYGPHRSSVRQQQRQTLKSIEQQKAFLVRKLARQLADCKAHNRKKRVPSGEKDMYETEILAIVHEEGLTALELKDLIDVKGPDDIDKLLDSTNFDYSYCESSHDEETEQEKEETEVKTVEGNTSVSSDDGDGNGGRVSPLHENEFDDHDDDKNNTNDNESSNQDGSDKSMDTKKKKRAKKNDTATAIISIDQSTLVPLEVKVLRAQHTEWMYEHQMDCVRTFQQQEMERMYDIRTEQQLERETLRSTNHLQSQIEALQTAKDAWQVAYHQHVENQETLIAYLRDHVAPEHRDPPLPSPPPSPISEKDLDETTDDIVEAEQEDTIESVPHATDHSSRLSSRQQLQLQRPKRGGARNIWAQLFASETNNNNNNSSNGNNKESVGKNTSTADDVEEDHDEATNTNENGIPTSIDASTKSPAVDRDDTDNNSLSVTSSISHTLISPLTADTTRRKFRLSFGNTSVTTPTTPSKKMSSGFMAKFGGFGVPPLTTNTSTDNNDDNVNGNDNTINININTVEIDDQVDGERRSDTSMDLIRTTKPSDSLNQSLLPDSLNERRVKRAAARKAASSTRNVSTAKRSSNRRKTRTKESRTDVLELVRERKKPAETHHDTNESTSAFRRKNAVVRDLKTDKLSKSSDHSLQER